MLIEVRMNVFGRHDAAPTAFIVSLLSLSVCLFARLYTVSIPLLLHFYVLCVICFPVLLVVLSTIVRACFFINATTFFSFFFFSHFVLLIKEKYDK